MCTNVLSGTDIEAALKARNLWSLCTDEIIARLKKGSRMTVSDAFEVYIHLKCQGCHDEWEKHQKPDARVGKNWKKILGERPKNGKKDLVGHDVRQSRGRAGR